MLVMRDVARCTEEVAGVENSERKHRDRNGKSVFPDELPLKNENVSCDSHDQRQRHRVNREQREQAGGSQANLPTGWLFVKRGVSGKRQCANRNRERIVPHAFGVVPDSRRKQNYRNEPCGETNGARKPPKRSREYSQESDAMKNDEGEGVFRRDETCLIELCRHRPIRQVETPRQAPRVSPVRIDRG